MGTCYTPPIEIEVDEYLLINCFLPAGAAAEGTGACHRQRCVHSAVGLGGK